MRFIELFKTHRIIKNPITIPLVFARASEIGGDNVVEVEVVTTGTLNEGK